MVFKRLTFKCGWSLLNMHSVVNIDQCKWMSANGPGERCLSTFFTGVTRFEFILNVIPVTVSIRSDSVPLFPIKLKKEAHANASFELKSLQKQIYRIVY